MLQDKTSIGVTLTYLGSGRMTNMYRLDHDQKRRNSRTIKRIILLYLQQFKSTIHMLFKTETLSVASNNQQGLETNAIARISSFRQVYCATVAKERQGAQMDIREHKGQRIADRLKVKQKGDHWLVPSESGPTRYTVTP